MFPALGKVVVVYRRVLTCVRSMRMIGGNTTTLIIPLFKSCIRGNKPYHNKTVRVAINFNSKVTANSVTEDFILSKLNGGGRRAPGARVWLRQAVQSGVGPAKPRKATHNLLADGE